MAIDLYGESYVSNWDYARKIVTLCYSKPFYRIHSHVTSDKECSIWFSEENFGYIQPKSSEIDCPGLYTVYERTVDSLSCLYTGSSKSSMRHRVYRYVKELHGVSRHDEGHSGARKARLAGVSPNNLLVKFFPKSEFPKVKNLVVNYETLDETCAILLKSRFNKRRKA
jgi:hypothetical protein